VGPQLAALVRRQPQLKLRRVDVVNWGSPVAEQYSIRCLPTLWLYENGSLASKDSDVVLTRLAALK
jgi:hypothetical protein